MEGLHFTKEQVIAVLDQLPCHVRLRDCGNKPNADERSGGLLRDGIYPERLELLQEACGTMDTIWEPSKVAKKSSYSLKHVLERRTGYISNGEFIAACLMKNYKVEFYPNNINASIYVKKRTTKRFKPVHYESTFFLFPPEIVAHVFSYLRHRDLAIVRHACHTWQDLSHSELRKRRQSLKYRVGETLYIPITYKGNCEISLKQSLDEHIVDDVQKREILELACHSMLLQVTVQSITNRDMILQSTYPRTRYNELYTKYKNFQIGNRRLFRKEGDNGHLRFEGGFYRAEHLYQPVIKTKITYGKISRSVKCNFDNIQNESYHWNRKAVE
jgi:hypothetical protein